MTFQRLFRTSRNFLSNVPPLHCSVTTKSGVSDVFKVKDNAVMRYREDGVICLRGLFSEYWIDKVREGIRKVLLQPSEYSETLRSIDGKGIYFNDYLRWRQVDEFAEYVRDSPAASIAATLLSVKVSN